MTEHGKLNLLMVGGDTSVIRGLDTALYRMQAYWSQHWARIDIITPHAPHPQRLRVYDNIYFHPSKWPNKLLQPLHILRMGRKLLAERHYDLIVTNDYGFFYNGIGAWLLTRGQPVPYVSEIHHVEGFPFAVTLRERLYRMTAMIYLRLVWRFAAGIRVVNQTEVPALLTRLGVPQGKILYLPSLYLDYDMFRPMPAIDKSYDVLFVGRLAANKGLFTILAALAQVRQSRPDLRACFLGSGPLKARLERQISALGLRENVTLLERMDSAEEVAKLYNQSKMLVCASTAEGGPRVTVEAMACGTAVISTPIGVMPEILTDGENGLLFRWDTDELAQKIGLLLEDEALRERLTANGRESVQHFQADEVIAGYARGYHELVAELRQGSSS